MSEAAALVFSGVVLGGVVAMLLLIRVRNAVRFKPFERLVEWHGQMTSRRTVAVYNVEIGPMPIPEQEAGWVEVLPSPFDNYPPWAERRLISLRLTDKAIGVVETARPYAQASQPVTRLLSRIPKNI